MAKTIALANQKGGVGKTTTAVNLAASLAAAEFRVLAVDMDPQGNLSSGLGYPQSKVGRHAYHVLTGAAEASSVIVSTELSCLHLMPTQPDLTGAEVELVDEDQRHKRLADALLPLDDDYDLIVIDCPPSLGLLTLNSLVAASAVVIPMQCEYYALEGLAHLLNTIERIRTGLNEELSVEGIVLCMYDKRMNLTRQVEHEVRTHFPKWVYETVIPRNVRLGESPSFGKPVLLYDIDSVGARSYMQLAKEFIRRRSLEKTAELAMQSLNKESTR